jgi:hypothetical protein
MSGEPIKDKAGLTAFALAQKLQENFTHRVSPEFFGKETFIKTGNCAVWKKIENIIFEHSNNSNSSLQAALKS